MRDLTIQDIRKVAQGRYMRKHRGKMMIVIGSWLGSLLLFFIGFMMSKGSGVTVSDDRWIWIFVFASGLVLLTVAYVILAIVFSYLESRFIWKFQQEWSDNNKTVSETYRS